MAAAPVEHLVLYGSLRRDSAQFRRLGLEEALAFLRPVAFKGVLYDLGDYPGAAVGRAGQVVGDLFRILDPSVVDRLDAFEVYDPGNLKPYCEEGGSGSLFVRRTLALDPPAWIYAFNGQTREGRRRRFPRIESGDWLAHAADRA